MRFALTCAAAVTVLAGTSHAVPTHPPTPLDGLDDAIQLARSTNNFCALRRGGAVVCWGGHGGAYGTGSAEAQDAPVAVPALRDARHIAGGTLQFCAARATGAVVCWRFDAPAPVAGVRDAIRVAVGSDHACALRKGGRVVCWGDNAHGQLGTGAAPASSARPLAVDGLTEVVELVAFGDATCAARRDRSVVCWGRLDGHLERCPDTTRARPAPVELTGTRLAMSFSTVCALDRGRVACRVGCEEPPSVAEVRSIAAGGHTRCFVVAGGRVRCAGDPPLWGDWARGEPGDDDDVPRELPGVWGATALAFSTDEGCALLASGSVTCWGRDR